MKDFNIDWNNAREEQQDKKQNKTNEGKTTQIEKNESENKIEKVEEISVTQNKKIKIQTKFEKTKLRPVNFVAWILIIISNLFIAAASCYIVFTLVGPILSGTKGIETLFGKEITAFSLGLFPFIGVLIYALLIGLLLLIITFAVFVIIFAIRNIINVGRLNYAKDEDYTKNILIIKSIVRLFILIGFSLLSILSFSSSAKNYSIHIMNLFKIGCIISSIMVLACAIMLIVELNISEKRYKESTSKDVWYPVMVEKKKNVKNYFFKKGNALRRNIGNKKGLY